MTMHNEELLAKETVFHLRFNWCSEEGLVKLLILCFAILKADDIRVVWYSRVNEHNETLWASSFILVEFADVEDIVVKRLSQLVSSNLKAESLDEDYTCEPSH